MQRASIMTETRFREAVDQLRGNVQSAKAVVLIGPDGIMLDHTSFDPSFDAEAFSAEYAMLLRIAERTSDDTGSGSISEHIMTSERAIMISRRFASNHYLVLLADANDQIGRARYELRRAAWYLEQTMHARR